MKYSDHLRVLPADLKSAPAFYFISLRTFIDYFILHKEFKREEEVRDLIKVRVNGIVFNVRKGNFIHDIQHYLLRQEINVRKWFNFRKGGIFVDVGAYIGAYTLRAAKHGSIVFSFEPNPYSFKILSLNVLDNKFDNVKLYNVALGNKECEVFISTNFDETYVSSDGYKIKMITLDSLSLNKVDLLKIDVEGYEKEVLLGSESTLDRTDKVIIEVPEHNKRFVDTIMYTHGLVKEKEELTYAEGSIYYVLYVRKR